MSEWRSTSEPPDNERGVLVHTPTAHPRWRVQAAYYHHVSGTWLSSGAIRLGQVTHWMELPKAPESRIAPLADAASRARARRMKARTA